MTEITTAAWTMPALDTTYYLESGGTATLAMLLKDVPLDLYPTDAEGLELLLTCRAAWEDRDEMMAALAMRHSDEYMRNVGQEPELQTA